MRERETARTAASTSAAEQSETVPTTVPFSGSRTSSRTVGGRHEPAQKAPPGGIHVPCRELGHGITVTRAGEIVNCRLLTTYSRTWWSGDLGHIVFASRWRSNTGGVQQMARLRWASGIAVVALTVTACGMGGDDSGTNNGSGDGEGSGGGNVVYAEFTPPLAAWAPGDRRWHPAVAGRLPGDAPQVRGRRHPDREPGNRLGADRSQDVAVHVARGCDVPRRHADGCGGGGRSPAARPGRQDPSPFVQPRRGVRRGGRRRLHRCDHHAGSQTCCSRCGLPARTPGSWPRRPTQAVRSTSWAPAPDRSPWSTRCPVSRSRSSATRTTGVARSPPRRPRSGSSSTEPPGSPRSRRGRRRSRQRSRRSRCRLSKVTPTSRWSRSRRLVRR